MKSPCGDNLTVVTDQSKDYSVLKATYGTRVIR